MKTKIYDTKPAINELEVSYATDAAKNGYIYVSGGWR